MAVAGPRASLLCFIQLVVLLSLAGCGGGGSSSSSPAADSPPVGAAPDPAPVDDPVAGGGGSDFEPGVFEPSRLFEAQCAAPRTGIDPVTGRAWPDAAGSFVDENEWLRAWSHELYLWYDEIEDVDPASLPTLEYFERMKTLATTASGAPKDRYHYTVPTDRWRSYVHSGEAVGYGYRFVVADVGPPRRVVVAYAQRNRPVPNRGLSRGDEVLFVDGVDVRRGNTRFEIDRIVDGLYPRTPGATTRITVGDPDDPATQRTVELEAVELDPDPVWMERVSIGAEQYGYLRFHEFVADTEAQLVEAVESLRRFDAPELVLDLRYNGGGLLDIASQLAYMIGGPAAVDGKTFERLVFNDKHQRFDPVTGAPLEPVPFHDVTLGFSTEAAEPLPFLDLERVFVLTGPNTCSASEALINGLEGAGVEVVTVGGTTCGKPYGFYPRDNCGTTYFSIQFRVENHLGFGDYADGFVPDCPVEESYDRVIGDGPLFAAVREYVRDGSCPRVARSTPPASSGTLRVPASEWLPLERPAWRDERVRVR